MTTADIHIRIDSHVHIMPPRRLRGLVRWIHKMDPNHPVPESVTQDDIVETLKKNGITHFFNLVYPLTAEETGPLNKFNVDFCKNIHGAIPFAGMHQDTPHKAKLAEKLLADHPFVGFKFQQSVQGFEPWDSRMDELYAFLEEAGRPVLLHTGFGTTTAEKLEGLLKRFPRLPVVFVHAGFPEIKKICDLMDDYPELYLDATLVLPLLRPSLHPILSSIPGGREGVDALITSLEKYKDRIMYGSDYPVGMGALEDIYAALDELPVPDSIRESLKTTTPMAFISRFMPDFNWSNNLQEFKNQQGE